MRETRAMVGINIMYQGCIHRQDEVPGLLHGLSAGESIGNRFLIYDCRIRGAWEYHRDQLQHQLIQSQRDTLLILEETEKVNQSLRVSMKVLEKDGSLSNFCGNGARALCRYLRSELSLEAIRHVFFPTASGTARVATAGNHSMGIDMGMPRSNLTQSPYFSFHQYALVLIENSLSSLRIVGKRWYFVDALEPHLYCFDLQSEAELVSYGKQLNNLRDIFPQGINVNCVCWSTEKYRARICTYERGVNHVTKACGTGATGLGYLVYCLSHKQVKSLSVTSAGGCLRTTVNDDQGRVILTGDY